ncbi:hypothetical protein EC845_0914 [Comamonas sp. BIGb0124]|nr:hypothetical protein [Comamonas sp. BIGb0124]ROR24880.1 hypothetical protein EC845_0914 [Comamonas sp. BIGb0124]
MTQFQRVSVWLVGVASVMSVAFVLNNHSNDREPLFRQAPSAQVITGEVR